MSFIKRFQNMKIKEEELESTLNKDFYEKLFQFIESSWNNSYYMFYHKISNIISKETGKDFKFIWKNSNLKDKIEIILFIDSKKNIFNHSFDNHSFDNYLEQFYDYSNFITTFNKINHYIKQNGYKIVDNWKIIDTEESHILSNSTKEEKANYLDFKNQKTFEDKCSVLFKEIKPIYKELKNFKKQKFGQIIKLEELNRLIEVFVRHDKESTDVRKKEYFDKLSKKERINKLEEMYLIILILKHQMKQN